MTAEHEALLGELRAVLAADPRVRSLWLSGSLGRGEGDAWSDIDALLVVADDALDQFYPAVGWLAPQMRRAGHGSGGASLVGPAHGERGTRRPYALHLHDLAVLFRRADRSVAAGTLGLRTAHTGALGCCLVDDR